MRIALRADASPTIGFGHVARCLALAEALVHNGHAVALIGAEPPAALRALASQIGVSHLDVSASGQRADAAASLEAIGRWGGADVCLVDHHALGRGWESAAREAGCAVAAIDDLGREHDCDLLIDANAGVTEDNYRGRVDPGTWLLLGPRYAMLRRGFREGHEQVGVRRQIEHILVSYGGTDPTGETAKAIEAVATLDGVTVEVAVTSAQPQLDRVLALAADVAHLKLHVDRNDLERLLADADLVLGAAGISALERACLGVPSVATIVADNQAPGAAALADAGVILLLGEAATVTPARLCAVVEGLRACPDALARMSARGPALVDGRGAERVAAALTSLRFELRRATLGDAQSMFEWRDHPRTRAFSLDPRPLDWEAHQRWLAERLADANCDLLVASDDVGPIGVLRFDVAATVANVSVYLLPQRQGTGLGAPLLRAGERWLRQNRPRLTALRATILEPNRASLRVFAEAGYEGAQRDLVRPLTLARTTGGSA
jgi:UDP-2,4-diacetamido-2,4,6-trideoxy-beta-L-altropyranose hydrolase